jgi:hypothetical protein
MSTQNTNVSVFPNLETSEWLGRAAGGRGAPLGVAQRPTDARNAEWMKPLRVFTERGVSLLGT